MTRTLSRPERIAWVRLARTPRIGPLTFHRLIARHRTAAAALEALPRVSNLTAPPAAQAEAEIDGVEALGGRLIACCEPDYPPLLAQLDAPAPVIAVRGDANLLKQPTVALVGSREGSGAALMFAERVAADLGAAGLTVVSGLARGVDAAAHKGALETGTVGVLAGGLDHPYPPQNQRLHDMICERGAVISEAPLGAVARARDFPRRNWIISGVSRGVVIIEAALRSGSLITARAAAEQGRDVMAAPGSPLDPRAHGSNALIKQGATLIENAADVIAALGETRPPLRPHSIGPLFESETPPPPPGLPGKIRQLLSPTPIHVNDLARLLETPAGAVAAALTELEMNGQAASLPGGYAASAGAAFG
ncbi:MAG TPA: DNA-processing protein DprA [Vitreimonas sp.]|uniref:DNA-processing protein DprA n=1 Tax=Vitreimonas sp. TaxID=3069702 RepID=UPI002D4F5985|nr:DNA-processing protein DprA [Vitreimonas sp.]HYD86180.1 DNA-processing protein DprA [Vitreimonas sp.]